MDDLALPSRDFGLDLRWSGFKGIQHDGVCSRKKGRHHITEA
jgi:hypothetical protein